MDTLVGFITLGFVWFLVLAYCAWRILNWLWFTPLRLEMCLRKQGLKGNSYRFLVGDLNDNSKMIKEAISNPIHLTDDILPRVLPSVCRTLETYGENSFIWFGPTPRLQIRDPELIQEVLNNNYRFKKLKQSPTVRMFAYGLASLEGDHWAQHKKLLKPAFYVERVKLMLPVMYISCTEMISKWDKLVTEKNGWCDLDVAPYLQTLTSDVISHTAFGSSYEDGKRVFELQREQTQFVMKALQSVYIPGWRFLPTKDNKRMEDLNRKIESSLREIIYKKMKAMRLAGESCSNDLLGILLECISDEQQQLGSKHVALSLADVIGECKLFYFAGQETTSSLLVWTMILLSIHPAWQNRAREEVFQVFGNRGKPNFDNLSNLKVVTMILKEVLRLYPPVHILTRKVHEDTKLGNLRLPVGVELSLLILLVHYDEQIWGDDAKEFKPERFSEGVIMKATGNNSQASYCPFGVGHRMCIGQNFALLEAKLALATILQHFSFELSPSYTHAPATVLILQPQHGARLIIHKLS